VDKEILRDDLYIPFLLSLSKASTPTGAYVCMSRPGHDNLLRGLYIEDRSRVARWFVFQPKIEFG
jgi:hypothetical protein